MLNCLILNLNLMSMFPGNQRVENVAGSDSERIEMSVDSKESKIYASQKLAKFFELEVTLKVFGNVIWSWVFPPKN